MADIQIIEENVDLSKFNDSQLPTDVHIVTYVKDGKVTYDAVRGYAMVDIFDVYYDKLKGTGHVTKIKSGYGKIKPKLYGKIQNEN